MLITLSTGEVFPRLATPTRVLDYAFGIQHVFDVGVSQTV
jgi:hypothetical protein